MLSNQIMEASVLGTILNNNDLLYQVIDQVNEDCFADLLHKEIYSCMKKLIDEGEKVSPARLWNRFAKVLGEDNKNYLSALGVNGNAAHLTSNLKHLKDLAFRRKLSSLCSVVLDRLTYFDDPGVQQAAYLVNEATSILTGTSSQTCTDNIEAMCAIYDDMRSNVPAYCAKTGLRILDRAMAGGLYKNRVYAITAPAKCGKTMLATTISSYLCQNAHKHLFLCAEMGSREISYRMLGQTLGVAPLAFLDRLNKVLIDEVGSIIPTMKRNIIFEDVPGVDFEHLQSLVELHVHKNKIEGFILDYFQLVSGGERNQTQAQHLENVANWIHRVCKRHNIWCVVLVQTNDELKVLGSRGLNRACDQIYRIERPLDEQGDPVGSAAWLKLISSRYTRTYNLGSESEPCLRIHKNGTHFEEVVNWGNSDD